jgi:hypothetical protein
MIKLSRGLSAHISGHLRKRLSECAIVDAPFLDPDRETLVLSFQQALSLESNRILLLGKLVEDLPRNKPDYTQFWLITVSEVASELRNGEDASFTLLDPEDDWVVSPDLGPDHKGGFELTVSETLPLRVVPGLQALRQQI